MKRKQHEGRSLGKKRKMLGLTQHDLARQANLSVNRIVFAETGRICLEPDEIDRVRGVFRKRARQAMDAVA
jgi:predicted transcriptional regulator